MKKVFHFYSRCSWFANMVHPKIKDEFVSAFDFQIYLHGAERF